MARYISEDDFVAWVKEHWCANCENDNGLRCRVCWIDDAIDIVEEAPEADVVPKSEVAREIIDIVNQRLTRNKERGKGVESEYWAGIYEGRKSAYQDIKEIIEQKYTEV